MVVDIGSVLLMMIVLLVLARIGSRIFASFGLPGLIGEIIVGIIIANIVIGDWSLMEAIGLSLDGTSSSENYKVLYLFAELGVIFLLFAVGLETKVSDLMSVGKAAMLVAVMGVIVPFVLGFAAIQIYDGNMNHAMFMGAAMVATSVGITARVIKDMKLLETRESRIIIGAAVIDDILGMIVLAIVVGMTESGLSVSNIASISIQAVVFVLVIIAAAKFLVPRVNNYFEERNRKKIEETGKTPMYVNKLILALLVCFGMSLLADVIGLAMIIGAFLGGMLLAEHAWEWELEEKIESITSLFISFFFVNVGLQVNLGDFGNTTVILLVVVTIVLAVISKYVGCSLGARLGDRELNKSSRNIIGIGMIPRGEVGIIVASIGLASGAMSSELYAVVVMMAVATTIIAPPLLSKAFRKKYPEEYSITPDIKL